LNLLPFLGLIASLALPLNHEVRIRGKERHLAFRIATIGTVGIGLDEFSDGEAIRSLFG
jgi:hypothetical protein